MPNLVAYLALIVWPFVAVGFYRKFSPLEATLWTIVGGYLILPVSTKFDFPLIPALDKQSISVLIALFGCKYIARQKIDLVPKTGLEKWLVILVIFSPVITVLNNFEPTGRSAGLSYHDAISAIIEQYIGLIPFILGLQLVKSYEDQIKVFQWVFVAALVYTLPALLEVRLSPQLHSWIYGFFPHTFAQQIRGDGFRPAVFLGHGLLVAMFFSISISAGLLLWKEKRGFLWLKNYKMTLAAVIYLLLILILCKSSGALVFGLVFVLFLGFQPASIIKMAALVVISIFIMYPFLSILNYFPHEGLVELAGKFSADRAHSLEFRFFHEGRLLELAQEKLIFGWGGWGRNRLVDSVTDGYWVLVLGMYGLVGFGTFFGLAVLSVVRATRASNVLYKENGKRLLIGHAFIVSIIMVDQIVNVSLSAWLWLVIGALLGRANYVLYAKPVPKSTHGNQGFIPKSIKPLPEWS